MITLTGSATLMDTLAFDTAPPARRLIELLKERGWTQLERVDPTRGAAGTRPEDTAVQSSRCERCGR
ncbi:MerR family transcriptional regulator [Streptomyces sp. NBRC 110611]|nr:MerR family transcriptional regulator [Streptomyces sp. NBRC 110611]